MKHVILLNGEHESPAPALTEALREVGVITASITAANGAKGQGDDANGAGGRRPLAVLCEIEAEADADQIHAAVNHAAAVWPGVPLVACRRHETPEDGRRSRQKLDGSTLKLLGFRAIADEPAQLPALLRELEAQGTTGEFPPPLDELEIPPSSILLPERLGIRRLRLAFEVVASLHFTADQKCAAATALAGLASLVRADRWTIFLTGEVRSDPEEAIFEPLAVRGLTASAMPGDALKLSGAESRAARTAAATAETVRKSEGGRRIIAVPLVSGERVLGVLEAIREGSDARAFSADDASLLSALAVPLTAALANSVRIAEAERLSQTDDLTKLHNARFLRQYLIGEVKRARRYGSMVTALFIDLDDFKRINDQHGHLVGSHVLMEMAGVILASVRDTDIVARYGGDEFVVVLPETGAEQASLVAERVRERIAEHVFTGGRRMHLMLTASFGVAAFPQHAQSPQQLIACADNAMYEAKAARKNCIRFAAETVQER